MLKLISGILQFMQIMISDSREFGAGTLARKKTIRKLMPAVLCKWGAQNRLLAPLLSEVIRITVGRLLTKCWLVYRGIY